MSTSVNIFRNTISSSSSGGGKEEQTKSVTITENGTTTITPDEGKTLSRVFVTTDVGSTAVGKGVFEYDYNNDLWIKKTGIRVGDEYGFGFTNENHRNISVTTDGNEPRDDGENILFSISSSVGDYWILKFHYQTNDEIYRSSISVTNPET